METVYIVDAANRIFSLLSQTLEPSQEDLTKVFAIACNTLKQTAAQARVLEDLIKLEVWQEKYQAELKGICEDVDHFTYGFCKIEERLMILSGVSKEAVKSLLDKVKSMRECVTQSTTKAPKVLENITMLRDEVCNIAEQLRQFPIDQQEKREAMNKLRRIAYGIGGIAIIGINVSSFATMVGLSAPGAAVSGAVGGALIEEAVTTK